MTTPAHFDLLQCDLDTRTLIEASAGTGKTWNISGLYLRLLLEKNLKVDQILVVTFTKAATAELRERIRARIVEMLDALRQDSVQDKFLARLLQHLTGGLGHEVTRLVQTLDLALQSFDEAAICTIHAFCQRALAESPFAAGMPFSLDITQDDHQEVAEAVSDFWRRRINREISPALAKHLVQCKDTPEKYQRLLRQFAGKPTVRVRWPAPEALDADDIQARMAQHFEQARALWRSQGEQVRELLGNANLKETHNAEKLAEAFEECGQYLERDASQACGARARLLCASKIANAVRKGGSLPAHPLFECLQALLIDLPEQLERVLAMQRRQLLRDLLEEGVLRLAEAKRERRLVSYDDLLVNLHRALTDGSSPWLADTLRRRFPVALIDEFQDTDPLQFEIFSRIHADAQSSLFLVGDPKQAIYSFRNADLHTYLQARNSVAVTRTLASNQRSSQGLIDALNSLFGSNPQAFLLRGLDYHPVAFGEKPRLPFVDADGPASELQVWMLPGDDQQLMDRRYALELATAATAGEIARLINQGAAGRILLNQRGLLPGDIAVLVRSHREAARIRLALLERGVASIEISQDSVFESSDAADVETILCAVLEPTRQGLVLAALATPLLGFTAAGIDALAASEARLTETVERFVAYKEAWFGRGLGFMFRQLIEREGISGRLLRRPDGERRMTNLRHLGEMLQQLQQQSMTPESALRWLQAQRREAGADESAQLRLESDRDLVQILTIHKSKGLEYPVVFCPYLWDGYRHRGSEPDGLEYHDENGNAVIDFRIDREERDAAKALIDEESDAETLRLHYVALTRASHRCHIVAGPYKKKSGKSFSTLEGSRAMLNWFVQDGSREYVDWKARPMTPAALRTAWENWGRATPKAWLRELTDIDPRCSTAMARRSGMLSAREAQRGLREDWRISSFSGLVRGLGEAMAADHDEHLLAAASDDSRQSVPAGMDINDVLMFPRGSQAGECMHAAFEKADFTDPASWGPAIDRALALFPQPVDKVPLERQRSMLEWMMADVLNTPLAEGFKLAQVPPNKRLNELEFSFPAHGVKAAALDALLRQHGYRMGPLAFGNLDGFLKGFIDLVFEHDGKFHVLDWKSNHLGYRPEDYGLNPMQEAMTEHGYTLQYLIYAFALHRYLTQRLPGYSYERHFGGVSYLFVRGVRPGWKHGKRQCGVFADRPTLACIEALDALFGSAAQREAA